MANTKCSLVVSNSSPEDVTDAKTYDWFKQVLDKFLENNLIEYEDVKSTPVQLNLELHVA